MTKQEAIDLIKLRLGSRDDTDLDALIEAELAISQAELEITAPYPWFCLKRNALQVLVEGGETIATPLDFVVESDEGQMELAPDNATFTEIQKVAYDDMREYLRNAELGYPRFYSLTGTNFRFAPIPDKAYYARYDYYGRDTDITSIEMWQANNWLNLVPDYLTAHAGLSVATWIKDSEAMNFFAAKLQAAKTRYEALSTAREEANRSRKMED